MKAQSGSSESAETPCLSVRVDVLADEMLTGAMGRKRAAGVRAPLCLVRGGGNGGDVLDPAR